MIDGHRFPSLAEGRRYKELKLLEQAGMIYGLKLQSPFPVIVIDKYICTYLADFDYYNGAGRVIEDVKGVKTPVYKLKKKLVDD